MIVKTGCVREKGMISIRAIAQSVLVLAALVTLATAAIAATSTQTTSSKVLLLSPRIQPGQSFTWKGRLTNRGVYHTNRGLVEHFDSRTLLLSCTVLRGSHSAFIVSRKLKVFLPAFRPVLESDPSTVIGTMSPPQTSLQNKPPIIIRNGYEFNTDGPPLNYDPICKFYSVTMFGVPPPTLKIGTSWSFRRTTYFGRVSNVYGTTTVTKLDASKGAISLRIKMTAPHDLGINPYLSDMVITDGGVTTTEAGRGEYVTVSAIHKEIGTPNEVDIWSLQRP
jgi:hypothetical protein